jgi:hypothetical protein
MDAQEIGRESREMRFFIIVVAFVGAFVSASTRPSVAAECATTLSTGQVQTSVYLPGAKAAITKADSISYNNFDARLRLYSNAKDALKGAQSEADDERNSGDFRLCVLRDEAIYSAWLSASLENLLSLFLTKVHATSDCRQLADASRANELADAYASIAPLTSVDGNFDHDSLTHAERALTDAADRAHMQLPDIAQSGAFADEKQVAYETQKAVMTHSCDPESHSTLHGIAMFFFGF